jgi:hypothetical protein
MRLLRVVTVWPRFDTNSYELGIGRMVLEGDVMDDVVALIEAPAR